MQQEQWGAWEAQLAAFRLPEWENLPELELYMDQVVVLVGRYLSFPPQAEGDDKLITASIVNNYVRMKIMPPPVKKKYGRVHLAYLLMICTLKRSLPIAAIQRLIPAQMDEEETRALYGRFLLCFQEAAEAFPRYTRALLERSGPEGGPLAAAASATLSRALSEYLIFGEPKAE